MGPDGNLAEMAKAGGRLVCLEEYLPSASLAMEQEVEQMLFPCEPADG